LGSIYKSNPNRTYKTFLRSFPHLWDPFTNQIPIIHTGSIYESDLNHTGMTSFRSFLSTLKLIAEITFMYFTKLYWNHFQVFHYRAGRLEQLDHLRVSSHFHYRAGRLEQLDHLRVSSHFIIGQDAWNN
jgi:hypothetical protein